MMIRPKYLKTAEEYKAEWEAMKEEDRQKSYIRTKEQITSSGCIPGMRLATYDEYAASFGRHASVDMSKEEWNAEAARIWKKRV